MKPALLSAVILITAATSLTASAAPVLFSGISGTRSATANFSVTPSSQLQVTLSNVSTADVLVPIDVLTGVFFNVAGNPALTRLSATSGGPTYLGTTPVSGAGAVVGGEWSYLNNLAQYGVNSGISSSGLGIFGGGNVFPGANLADTESPGGLEYGLASLGDNQSTGNGGVTGNPLTRYSVTFLLGGINPVFNPLTGITSVIFQYGTNLSEPSVVGQIEGGSPSNGGGGSFPNSIPIPEPATMGLVGVALLSLGLLRRRKM